MSRMGVSLENIDEVSPFTSSSGVTSLSYMDRPSRYGSLTPGGVKEGDDSSEDEYGHIQFLTENIDSLRLTADGGHEFRGKTHISGVLAQAAQDIPSLFQAVRDIIDLTALPRRRPIFWTVIPVRMPARLSSSRDLSFYFTAGGDRSIFYTNCWLSFSGTFYPARIS